MNSHCWSDVNRLQLLYYDILLKEKSLMYLVNFEHLNIPTYRCLICNFIFGVHDTSLFSKTMSRTDIFLSLMWLRSFSVLTEHLDRNHKKNRKFSAKYCKITFFSRKMKWRNDVNTFFSSEGGQLIVALKANLWKISIILRRIDLRATFAKHFSSTWK